IRQKQGIADDTVAERVLTPYQTLPGKTPRYYQTAAGLDALLPGVLDRAFRGEL
ncbi:MAG: hypothetical protein HY558_06315, partial [Euryarchaeota archaeon]|nr:hypothetical protein [Euryarchaeota archaeon]